jgi:mRNA-degrading endonuclease RelE of RelBE toxin-antitoxin system
MIIIETSVFTKQINGILSDEEYHKLQNFLVENPAKGSVIIGSGGLRKLRWPGSGRGKRGGIRIIYYWYKSEEIILMLFIYTKNNLVDLTSEQIKILKNIMESEFDGKEII